MRNNKQWMKKIMGIMGLLIAQCSLWMGTVQAQTGTWKAYMAYSEVQQIVKGGNMLYVRASNDLYTYNLTDHSITTYDKVSALSDNYIDHIAWNQQTKKLLIIYQNSDMDLLDQQNNVVNLGSLYLKSMMQEKTVLNYYVNGPYIYLATGFGVVKINTERVEISESAILDQEILDVAISGSNIYAQTSKNTVLTALLSDNLQDPHNWTETTNVPQDVFAKDNSDWEQYYSIVETLLPGGPKYNYFNRMFCDNNKLYTSQKVAETNFEESLFHIIRAWHVAGRCTDCGECSRVCPQHIPLYLLNRKFIKDINEIYGEYQAGSDMETKPAMLTFNAEGDPETTIVYDRSSDKEAE
jgi:ferredoxin